MKLCLSVYNNILLSHNTYLYNIIDCNGSKSWVQGTNLVALYSQWRKIIILVSFQILLCSVLMITILCEELNTDCFNSHLHAYEVSHDREPSFVFVKQCGLADHSVLGLYKKGNISFVCKYRVL